MSWLQLILTLDQARAPLAEAALESAGALAVTLGDAGDDPLLEPAPGTMPLWQGVRVTALFPDDADSALHVRALVATLAPQCLVQPQVEALADRPWERVWLDEFRPTRFGRRLWVCPRGQPPGESADGQSPVVVDLDPGLAFGTGHHPTTALCLEWLDGADLDGRTLLDYGCGSGILAIAALRLGAARAIAVDHDPQALQATGDNAQINGVSDRLAVCLPADLPALGPDLPADLVVANILAGPLVELAPVLLQHLKPGGQLALSGILADQVGAVSQAYAGELDLEPPRLREDWALIAGHKRP